MKYALCISDLHFSRWLRNSPEPDYRMVKQPLALADRIISIMQEKQTKYLFILGDLIDAWNEEPAVLDVLSLFYQKIITAIPDVYIGFIEGQHDLCIRDRYNPDNSFVHLVASLFPNNVHYLHDNYLLMDGTSLYFSSYHREQPILPKQKVNIFCSHITLGMTDFDQRNFDLCVAGDIHAIWDQGKCHSCCTPYQLYPHEEPLGRIGLLTLNGSNSKFERLLSDSEQFTFLKLEATQKRNISSTSTGQKQLIFNHNELHKMIAEEVHKAGLDAIHNRIPQKEAPQPINFGFKFKKLIIDNVRSINHLELNLGDFEGITYVQGATGAGKSSIFYALITALCGAAKSELESRSNRITKKPLKLQLWLEYEGKEFYILRTVKETKFAINGIDISGSKKETQSKIEENLPFIPYWKYFFLKASQHYFESLDKTELLSVLFNLNIFNYLYTQGKLLLKGFNKELKDSSHDLAEFEGELKVLTQELADQKILATELFVPLDEIQKIEIDFKQASALCQKKIACESLNAHLAQENTDFERKITNLSKDTSLDRKSILEVLEALEADKEKVSKEKYLLDNLNNQKAIIENHISALKSNLVICPNCGKEFIPNSQDSIEELSLQLEEINKQLSEDNSCSITLEEINQKIKQLKLSLMKIDAIEEAQRSLKINLARLMDNNNQLSKIKDDLNSIYQKYFAIDQKSFESVYYGSQSKQVQFKLVENKIQSLESRISNKESSITTLQTKITDLTKLVDDTEKYISIFDISNLSSAPYSILKKLTTYLNADNIRFTSSTENDKFSISVAIKIGDQWIDYQDASDGQKNFLDMFILIRITAFLGGVGFLVMDEPFSNMDQQYIFQANSLLPEIDASNIFISSHTPIQTYDKKISVEQDHNGLSKINIL